MAKAHRLLSVLVPAYDEEATLASLLDRVLRAETERHGFSIEVIVCDDGSRDRTRAVAYSFSLVDRRVRVATHANNRGKGAAIRTALSLARGEYCLVQDADLEYGPEDYGALLGRVADGAPAVFGSRFLGRARPERMAAVALVANRLLTACANALFGLSLTDEATCLKMVRTDLLRGLRLECDGFEFCPEVVAKLALADVPILEVPVGYRARTKAEGKKIRWTDAFDAIWTLVRWRLDGARMRASRAPA